MTTHNLFTLTKFATRLLSAAALFIVLAPAQIWACACGCGVFDVGGSSMLPLGKGGTVYLEYDYMNQNSNWNGASGAPLADNDDKNIRSSFYVAGLQYMFNRSWGMEVQVPYAHRDFTTTDESTGDMVSFHHGDFGDIRVTGIYSGFSPDMSTGLIFGVKLPNGDYKYNGFDRDTAIGTGSTNSLLGFYHQDRLTKDNVYSWFVQGMWDRPFMTKGGYRPGSEVDAALGIYHEGWSLGNAVWVTPLLQLIGSNRLKDSGTNANPGDSGYDRLLLSPGAEISFGRAKVYGDVEVPIYQHVNGNQLVAPALFKMIVSYRF